MTQWLQQERKNCLRCLFIMAYTIAFFPRENSFDIIPTCWLIDGKDKCYWPPKLKGSAFSTVVEERSVPDRKSWDVHECEPLKSYDSYQKARKSCAKAEKKLDKNCDLEVAFQSTDCERKRKRIVPPRFEDLDESSQETDEEEWITILQKILKQQQKNTALLQAIYDHKKIEDNSGQDIADELGLPLESISGFEDAEKALVDSTKQKAMISHLASFGGGTPKIAIARMMGAVFKNGLAVTFNWKGGCRTTANGESNKRAFGSSRLARTLIDAAKESKVKEAESEALIKSWLRNTSDREGGRKRRLQKKLVQEKRATVKRALESSDSSA